MVRVWAVVVVVLGATPGAASVLRVGVDAPDLQGTLDAAADGDTVVVPPGTWSGPARIEHTITLRGEGGIIDGGGHGTVLVVDAPGVRLDDLVVRDSGEDLRGPDSCIYLTPAATDGRIFGARLSDCAFGIWIHETAGVHLVANAIEGKRDAHFANRGNGIQLFDAKRLVIRNNYVAWARDGIYVSATEESLIEGNVVEHLRYGVHYMYSYDNIVRGNISQNNRNGYALMQSRDLIVEDNVGADNEDHGLLFRDAQRCQIRRNHLLRNGQGMFFFSSTENAIVDNELIHNDVGVKLWAGSVRNEIRGNRFIGNRVQVFYVAASDLELGTEGAGNLWSDYLGWDQDRDGIGDRPYRVDAFTSNLVHRYPGAALLMNSPALELLSHLQQRMPVLRVPTLIDYSPVSREYAEYEPDGDHQP